MNPKWLIGILMMFVLCSIFSGIIEMAYIGDTETSVIGRLFYVDALTVQGTWGNITSFFTGVFTQPLQFLQALWDVLTWDYAMFHGAYGIVRILLFTVSAGLIVSFVLTLVRGVSSA